jgi:hypothetical protein
LKLYQSEKHSHREHREKTLNFLFPLFSVAKGFVRVMPIWNIGLESWIIQDGNYPDFRKGQIAEFALFFQPRSLLKKAESDELQATLIHEAEYNVTAKVVYTGRESWAIDFGLLAYTNQPPPSGMKVGSIFSADIWLGIDYYLYFQALGKIDAVPPMIYSWNVRQIQMQSAPFIKTISTVPGRLFGKEIFVRDPELLAYKEIEATDARNDDEGSATYMLMCEKREVLPKRVKS